MLATTKLVYAPAWQTWAHNQRLDSVRAVFDFQGGTIVKPGSSTEVRRVEAAGRTVFIKKYWVTRPNQLVSGLTRGSLVGRSKVRREFDNLQRLRQWGLDAPAPVAWGEERRAGWLTRSCLISEGVPNPLPLDVFIQKQSRRDLLNRLADYVRRLHEQRFEHHDLYWRNIILSGGSLDHFYLIDAHKGRVWRTELAGRAQDLATLDAPAPWYFRRTERLRFFLKYRQHDRLTAEDKQLLRRVLALAGPLRDRQHKRVRDARS